jgi:hypothetical protein
VNIRRIRRTPEERKRDLQKKLFLIPLPWILYSLGNAFFSPLWGGGLMIFAIFAYRWFYSEKWIPFQIIFLIFAISEVLMEVFVVRSSLFSNAGWFSGVLLGSFVIQGLVRKKPFTSDLVREFFPEEMAKGFHFHRINECITMVWGIQFFTSAAITQMAIPGWGHLLLTFGSMGLASLFTKRFPRWYRLHRYLPLYRSGKEPYQPFIEI